MNCLPEIEEIHKVFYGSHHQEIIIVRIELSLWLILNQHRSLQKKEKLLKKQQREALLLDSYLTVNGFTSGHSRRERKRVTYTFGNLEAEVNIFIN
jgi:hypothetical protein